MPLELAYQIIDICSALKIRHITLIGGEPTLYPHLFEAIDYCHSKKIQCGIVTNGLVCESIEFVEKLKTHNINTISVSLKGENAKVFKDITGVDAFEKTKAAIKNCLDNGVNVNASMVLTDDNIDTYIEGIATLAEQGVQRFRVSFCYEFDTSPIHNKYLQSHNPKKLISSFVAGYDKLNEITKGRFVLSMGYPLCLWDKQFLYKLKRRGQISTKCQLLAQSGLLFDSNGYLIPCNAMSKIKMGQLNMDFNTAEELLNHVNTPNIIEAYDKLCGLPDTSCLHCGLLDACGGGCVCQWTNYTFADLQATKE